MLKKIYKVLVDFICRLMDDNVGVYAAQASFFIVISVIPLIMLILSLLKLFLPVDATVLETLIIETMPHSIQSTLLGLCEELFDKTASVSVISITAISTIWLSSRGIMALYQGLNNVYHTDIRNYFYCRAMSIFYTLVFVAVLVLTVVVFSFGETIQGVLFEYAPFVAQITHTILNVRILIFTVLLTLSFGLFYRFLPQAKPHLKFSKQLPGAFGAAVGWMGFSYFYSIYIENFSKYSYIYGSLTAIVFLMLWLYFCMTIFLFGAQLNKMIDSNYFKKLISEFKN